MMPVTRSPGSDTGTIVTDMPQGYGTRARTTLTVVVVLILTTLAAAGVDTAVAARAERRLSQHAAEVGELTSPPEAYIGGFPYAISALTGSYTRVSVSALDQPLPGFGFASVGVDALGLDTRTMTANVLRRSVRLDAVALAQLLNLPDLDITNPYDISPAGGGVSEARLTATLPGTTTASTAVVTLRLVDGAFIMRPSEVEPASDAGVDDVIKALSYELDTLTLPLGGPADMVQLSGGSIYFSRDVVNAAVDVDDLVP